jgi:hypothetical protein
VPFVFGLLISLLLLMLKFNYVGVLLSVSPNWVKKKLLSSFLFFGNIIFVELDNWSTTTSLLDGDKSSTLYDKGVFSSYLVVVVLIFLYL